MAPNEGNAVGGHRELPVSVTGERGNFQGFEKGERK